MQTALNKILQLFRDNGVEAGQVLPKEKLTAEIRSWPPDEKAQMRNAWHTLVGEGYIQEGNPAGPTLTRKGRAAAYGAPP